MNFERQIAYDQWANKLTINAISECEGTSSDTELTKHLGHLLHAQIIWYNRVLEIHEKVSLWPELSLEECLELISGSSAIDLNKLVPKANEICIYKNSKGESFQTKVAEIIQHIIIHGQHHRAQIALLLRQKGITPPATDLIFFTRQD